MGVLTWLCGDAYTVDPTVLGLSVGTIFFGILNNVGLSQMSYAMPGFPSFNNYFVGAMSVIFFAVAAVVFKEEVFHGRSLTWRLQKQYLILGAITSVNWLGVQYAVAYIEADLNQLLSALSLPAAFIFSLAILRPKFKTREVLGSLGVFLGVLLGATESFVRLGHSDAGGGKHHPWFNNWYFILLIVISVIAGSLEYIWQERVYNHPYHGEVSACVFWYQLYGILPYLVGVFIETLPQVTGSAGGHSASWAWDNQGRAFVCLVGRMKIDKECASRYALLWVLVFIVGFVGMFVTQGYLYKKISAFWTVVLQTLITPFAAAIFSIRPVVGSIGYDKFSKWDAVSFAVIVVALVVRGVPKTPSKPDCPPTCWVHHVPAPRSDDSRVALLRNVTVHDAEG